jgi:serine/threonine protein kinase
MMTRPDTVQEVFSLVRRSWLIEDGRLTGFLALLHSAQLTGLTPAAVLSLMVERGLLTAYQADELAAGRWWGFWLGGYRILDRLGRGGMGTVFLAEHPLLGKRVAVKTLTGGLQADPGTRTRFLREARAAAALDHPNVVHVYHADADHDPPFLVMEYVDGVSLQAAVVRYGPFAPAEVAAVGVSVAHGLAAAAAVGLVHRDVKPANLLIDRQGRAKILDLGIARFTRDPDSRVVDPDVILGTLDYLAPEQAQNSSAVDPRADQYSLGATLYFLLTGAPPFPEADVSHKLHLKQHADPSPVNELRSDVPPGLSGVIQRMLARHPADRFAAPEAVAAALEPWADPGPDFPARLFRPWAPVGADTPGQPTDVGPEHDPTPIPLTQRIVRPRTGLTPTPSIPFPVAPAARPHGGLVSGVIPDPTASDAVPPTVRLTRPPEPPVADPAPVKPPRRWWSGVLATASILLRTLKFGWRRGPKPPPERSGS